MLNFWLDYRSEVLFLLLLLAVTSFSTWFGQFIDADVYDDILTPVFNTATVIASLSGAWILLRHSNGMRT